MARAVASAQDVNVADLLTPGPIGEKVLGPADAPVSVVEYASMSCPHCAHFDMTTFDDFKLKYIDSGKVRYIFREYPLNAPALAVAMLARCAPADKFFDIVHTFFRTQDKWLYVSDVKAGILDVGGQFGFTEQTFDACVKNQALFEAIKAVQDRGSAFGVMPRRRSSSTARSMKGRCRLTIWTRRSSRCSIRRAGRARAGGEGSHRMKVTRLRLHGFKSFADAIEVPVEPGITGVVGPNGCGKSNLVEALRFVMGESSYKAMRGGGMEDVIFSGSGTRPSRNMAEVTLGAERDEGTGNGPEPVEITRRIERDAGSSYRINGRDVRARDVQILFADAATGAHSSALVRQGQVAELIAAKAHRPPRHPGGRGRHLRPACPPQRSGAEASRRGEQSRPR